MAHTSAAPDRRFRAYLERLSHALGHRDRREPLRAYLTGLCLPGERKTAAGGAPPECLKPSRSRRSGRSPWSRSQPSTAKGFLRRRVDAARDSLRRRRVRGDPRVAARPRAPGAAPVERAGPASHAAAAHAPLSSGAHHDPRGAAGAEGVAHGHVATRHARKPALPLRVAARAARSPR